MRAEEKTQDFAQGEYVLFTWFIFQQWTNRCLHWAAESIKLVLIAEKRSEKALNTVCTDMTLAPLFGKAMFISCV